MAEIDGNTVIGEDESREEIARKVANRLTLAPVTDIWRTAEGERLRICDMTDSHLTNAITYTQRRIPTKWRMGSLDKLRHEARRRGLI